MSYASFNATQKQQIELLAASYHSWHRTTQLNRYSEFLRSVLDDVESNDELSLEQADHWWQSVRGFTDDMRACNPLNVAAELLEGLSDKQVSQIASKLRSELNEHEDEYHSESPEVRAERRVKKVTKWGKRAGASFNDAQTKLLKATLQNQISLGAQRYELRRIWTEELIVLLSQRGEPDFKNKVSRHIDSNWRITEKYFPEQWQANEKLWIGFIKDYINLQTAEQRQVFVSKFASTAQTLQKLSEKETVQPSVCHDGR